MTVMSIPVTKGKATLDVELDDIPDDVYKEIMLQGLKVLLNRGTSKITAASHKPDEMKAAAMEKAAENLVAVKTSKIKFTGGAKAKGASGVVMTEARRLARNLVKDEMKRQGIKISHVEASEITKAANALLTDDPSIIETAKANLAAREAIPVKIDVTKIAISPKLVAKAEADKAAKKGQLSAKQAGLTAKAKPKVQTTAQTQV